MTNLNYDVYFENKNDQYHEPKYMITIIEDILGSTIEDIRNQVNCAQITVTKEQITEFLMQKLEQEDPELKRRMESPKPKRSRNILELTQEDINAASQEFADVLNFGRYQFEPYTLEYFKKYSNIVRNKILLLLNIIEKIGNRDTISIQDLMQELDIQLDANGNISKEDIIRLITPLIYNVNALKEKVAQANDLSTYLTFKMSEHKLCKDNCLEVKIYPSSKLLIENIYSDPIIGNVPLSSKQKKKLIQSQISSICKW